MNKSLWVSLKTSPNVPGLGDLAIMDTRVFSLAFISCLDCEKNKLLLIIAGGPTKYGLGTTG